MKNIQKQYIDLLEGKMSKSNFMRNVRMQFPQYVSPVTSYDDSVKILKGKRILSEAKQPEGVYGHNPSAEVTKYPNFDTVNYNQLMKGMKYELSLMGEITDENLVLAKKKALEALTKDPMAYRELMIANQKAITEMDKDLKMKDVKEDNKVDKANGMKVVKKDAPAAANQSKKFTNKVEKVMQMTQTPKKAKGIAKVMEVPGKEKVLALKETILREFDSYKHEVPEHFGPGSRVMTKDKKKVGEVTEVEQDTATVKLDDGSLEHIQLNVLTGKDVPAKKEQTNETISGDQPNAMPLQHVKADDEKYKIARDSKDKIIKATNADGVEFQINDTAKLDPKDGGTEIQIKGFQESQGKVKAFYLVSGTGYTYDIDGLTKDKEFPIKGDRSGLRAVDSKFKSLKEKLTTAVKEILYKNKKNGKIQSFDQNHPEDKEVMSDPQFNQVFTKA
jgi:hypothetical protein